MKKFMYLLIVLLGMFALPAQAQTIDDCTPVAVTVGQPFVETFEDNSATRGCWSQEYVMGADHTGWVLTQSSSTAHGGEKYYKYCTASSMGCHDVYRLITPVLDMTNVTTATLDFWYKTEWYNTYSDTLQVYYRTSESDDWTLLRSFTTNTGDVWTNANIALTDYSSTFQLAFVGYYNWGYGVWLDDVTVGQGPSCPNVADLTTVNVTASSADISFTEQGSATAWQYVVSETALDDPSTGTIEDAQDNPFTISDLTANTGYFVYVRANCADDDQSTWVSTTFRTSCDAVTTLPFTENFDSYTGGTTSFPDCWTVATNYNNYPYIESGSNVNSAPNALKFAGSNKPTAVTPQFAIDIHTLSVTFNLKREGSSSGTFEVGVMSNPNDAATFELVSTIDPADNDYHEYAVDFIGTALEGENNFIAFRTNSTSTAWYYWLDDVTVDVGPDCSEPYNLAVNNLTGTSADLSWQDSDEEGAWQVLAVPEGTDPDFDEAETVSETPYTLTGLDDNTAYTVYVRTVCSNGEGYSRWASLRFMTISDAPAQVPYFHDFEDEAENEEWTLVNGEANNQWYIGMPAGYDDNKLYISSDSGATNSYGGAASVVWAYRDVQFGDGAEFDLSFRWKGEGEGNYDFFRVYVGVPNAVEAQTSGNVTDPIGWTFKSDNFNKHQDMRIAHLVLDNSYANGTWRIYFVWRNDISTNNNPPALIDSIYITATDCGRPRLLAIDSVGTESGDFHFTPATGNDNAWEYVIGTPGFDPDQGAIEAVSDTAFTVTDLTADTPYELYVRTDCGGEYSAWSEPLTFRTACPEFMTLPYTENFDSYDGDYPHCWQRKSSSTGYPSLSSSYSASGTYSLYFYSYAYSNNTAYNIGILPAVDVLSDPVNTLSLSFKMYKTTASYGACQIGVMTDPADETSFTTVDSINADDLPTGTWKEFEIDLAGYAGQGTHIAIRESVTGNGGYGGVFNIFYIDDIAVYTTPTCLKPLDVAVSQITDNSVLVDWTPRSGESAWQIAVVPAGEDVEESALLDADYRPFTVDELSANTTYDLYVRALCDDGSESVWSYPLTFTTMCAPQAVELPWSENFDGCLSGADAALPECWLKFTNCTTAYPYPSSSQASSGTMSINFYSNTSNYSYLVSPALDLSQYAGSPLLLTCKTLVTSSTHGHLNIGYMTDPADLSTFTLLKALHPDDYNALNTWYLWNILLPESMPETVYIAFVAPQGIYSTPYMDDVVLDYVPDCSAPSDLQFSDIAGASAVASWTESPYGAVDYTVEYSEAGEEDWQTISGIEGNRVLISGLMPTTFYDVRVFANCGSGESEPITGSFATGCLAGGEMTIGEGINASHYVPVNNYYKYTYSQQIFDAAELGGATLIRGFGLDYKYATPMSGKTDVVVYLAHTAQSTFATTSSWIPIDSAVQVYSGSLNCSQGWNTFMFETPFAYNGTDNLVLIVDDNSYAYNSSSYTFNTHSATDKALYRMSDSQNIDPASPGAGTKYSYRNNVKFFADCDSTVTCVAPNAFITAVDDQSATVEWAPGYDETSWEIEYKSRFETEWTQVGEVSASPYVLDGLNSDEAYVFRIRSVCSDGEYSDWVTLSFTTECLPITELPYMEDFDEATGSGAGNFISCWTAGTNGTSAYPYTDNTQSYSGPYSLYFYGSSSSYSYAATPRFDESIQMDSLLVSFYMRKASDAYFIEVGIMTDPNDISTFVAVGTASPAELDTWELAEIYTNSYQGTGRYLAFRTPQGIYNSIRLDDIAVQYIPLCTRVGNLTVDNITANSATVQWTPGGDETAWQYLYGPAGTVDPVNDVPEQVEASTADLDGLEPNTAYEVLVRGVCDDREYSPWTKVTFRTGCAAVTTLPFTENFDSYTGGTTSFPDCWTVATNYNNYPYIESGSNVNSAPNALKFAGNNQPMAVTPQFAIDIHTLSVTFNLKREGPSSGTFEVGVMSNPNDAATFELVSTIDPADNDYHEYAVDFIGTALEGENNFIAFRTNSTFTYWYYWLDDVTVDVAPSCSEPYNLAVSNLTGTSAELSWQDADGESSWQIVVATEGTEPDFSEAETVTSSTYSLSDLTANTAYTAYVRTVCANGEGYSRWASLRFMTISDAPAQVPYFHDFEDSEENSQWALLNGAAGSKWYIGFPDGAQDGMLYVSKDNGLHNSYDGAPLSAVWAYRDVQFGDGAEFELSFKWKGQGESSFDYMKFFLAPPAAVAAGTVSVPDGAVIATDYLNQNTGWTTARYVINSSCANTTQRLYFLWRNDGSIYHDPSAAVDSIQITATECGRPYDIAISYIGETSADVTFTPALAADNAWQYALGVPGFDLESATTVDISDTVIALTDLTSNTHYEIYVRTACASGDYSAWSGPIAFKTTCGSFEVPYTENFDGVTAGPGVLPDCWSAPVRYGSSNAPYVQAGQGYSNTYYHSSPNGLHFESSTTDPTTLVTPAFAEDIHNLQVTFYLQREGSNSGTFEVGVMSNPLDVSTFESVQTITPEEDDQWIEYTVYFPNTELTGENNYIAFRQNTNNTAAWFYWLDDVVVDLIPTCPPVIDLSVTNITGSTADISFTEQGSAGSWQYVISETALDDPATGNIVDVTTNTFTVSGLTENTGYYAYVRANCAADDQSNWASTTFRTACGVIAVNDENPFEESFEDSSETRDCWSVVDNNNDNKTWTLVADGGNGCYKYSWHASNAGDDYLFSPGLQMGAGVYNVTFRYKSSISFHENLKVQYGTAADVEAMTNDICDLPNIQTSTWVTDTFPMTVTGGVYYIGFKCYSNANEFTLYVDDVTVSVVGESCPAPTGLSATATATTADVSWSGSGVFEVSCKAAAAADWPAGTEVNGSAYTFTGLTPETAYDWRVRQSCDGGQYSGWAEGTFTTAAESSCPAPTGLTVTDVTANTATLNWQQEGDVESWTLNYRKTGDTWTTSTVTERPYTITDLDGATAYEAQLRANCGDGTSSEYTDIVTFSTAGTGIESHALENSLHLYPNPASNFIDVKYDKEMGVDEILVYDVYGKLLQAIKVTENPVRIDVSGLADGIYFVRAVTEQGIVNKSFVKR